MTDLSSLIAKLEQAESGSRELSWEIAQAIGWTTYWASMHFYLPPGKVEGEYAEERHPPEFTTSLDCALTLAPPDGWLNMGHRWNADNKMVCGGGWDLLGGDTAFARAKTFPLALCIAALKARSRVEGK